MRYSVVWCVTVTVFWRGGGGDSDIIGDVWRCGDVLARFGVV